MKDAKWFRYTLSGAAAGVINGLFGAGGGMVLVPMLIGFCRMEDKLAFSTAISIILPISLITLFIYSTKGVFPLAEALPYLLGGLIGGVLGGILFKKATPSFLHKFFGVIILWGGLRLIWT